MAVISGFIQKADWKQEKHVPVIEISSKIGKGQPIDVAVMIGKQVPHPNTTEHHISFIEVYFHPKDEKFPYQIGRFEFTSHGASAQGPSTSTVYAQPEIICSFKTEKSGIIYASSYCNIHGLWESSQELSVS